MKILLIAGHGAGDPGATAKIDGKTYKEAELTREVVANLKPLLEAYGVNVTTYPTSHDAYQDYNAGRLVSTAKFSNYDYVLEIHFNAGRSDLKGDGKVAGDECFWPSRGKATGLEKPMTSRLFKGYAQRASRSGKYAVINTAAGNGVKANLLEVCFIDDADDMRIYLKNKSNIAQNIAEGVAEYYGLKKAATVKKSTETAKPKAAATTSTKNKTVRVTASALNIRKGPSTNYPIVGVIKDKGVYTIVEEKNGWGRLKKGPVEGSSWISLTYTKKV